MSDLTPEQRIARLTNKHHAQTMDWGYIDGIESKKITFVERELGFPIMGDYPLMKFLQQYEDLMFFKEREANGN